jgi:hypothetical protein
VHRKVLRGAQVRFTGCPGQVYGAWVYRVAGMVFGYQAGFMGRPLKVYGVSEFPHGAHMRGLWGAEG